MVALNIESQPLVTSFPTRFPPSRMYFFKPLNERVPVYENPFTLMEDIELEGTPQAQAALRGTDSVTRNRCRCRGCSRSGRASREVRQGRRST